MYLAGGYDTLVPEYEVAELLNVNGQIQVSDTIYKISPKGTYFYPKALNSFFISNYDKFESMEGTSVGDNLYNIIGGIYRYETFNGKLDYMFEENKLPTQEFENSIGDDSGSSSSSSSSQSAVVSAEGRSGSYYYDEIDWSEFPVHDTDDVHWFNWLWSKLFGCDKGYSYKLSDNRRVKVKLYYYNYIFVASTGAYVEMQKKNWIGWSGKKAAKLFLKWDNVIFKSNYKNKPNANMYPNDKPAFAGTVYGVVPGFKYNGYISSYVGVKLTNDQLEKLKALAGTAVYNWLKGEFGIDPPKTSDVIMLYADDEVITVIPNGWKSGNNVERIGIKFAKSWGFMITIDFLNLPSSWYEFATCINGLTLGYPELLNADIRGAACLDNNIWGGVILEKR